MVKGACFLVMLLSAHSVAYAQIPPLYAPENTPDTAGTQDRVPHTGVPAKQGHPDKGSSETAQSVIEMADLLKSEGNLQKAAFEYRRAALLGKDKPKIRERALSELNFYIPVIIARQLAISGKHASAKKILEAAAARSRKYPDRIQQLTTILNAIALVTDSDSSSSTLDGKSVKNSVTRILKRYQQQSGHYPITRDELIRILPPNKFPLIHFAIRNYRGNAFGFSLELQSTSNPGNKIHVRQTGLMR